jgi:hypothetical protein
MTEVIAEITTFDDLRVALASRKSSLRLRNLDIDEIAGLQGGYTGKILCGMKRPGDMSLPAILGALQCKLALIPSSTQERLESQAVHGTALDRVKKKRKKASSNGGRKSTMDLMTAEERKKRSRKMNRVRWARARAKRRLAAAENADATRKSLTLA